MADQMPTCANCGRPLANNEAVCGVCEKKIDAYEPLLEIGSATEAYAQLAARRSRPSPLARRVELALDWLAALLFLGALLWPNYSSQAFPLPGLRKIAEPGMSGVLQTIAVILGVIWLTATQFHTRERLLIFRGMALCLTIQGFLYIGVPFAVTFSLYANASRQTCERMETPT